MDIDMWILLSLLKLIINMYYFNSKFIKLILKIKHLQIYNFFNMNMSFFTTEFWKSNQSIDGLVV